MTSSGLPSTIRMFHPTSGFSVLPSLILTRAGAEPA